MPTRKDYPIPECPNCGKRDSRVLNTHYTVDRDIVRLRECNFCSHRLWTQQSPEEFIDPDVYRVIIPKFSDTKQKRVSVRHKSIDLEYRQRKERQAARANDQPQPTRWNREPSYKMQPPRS